MKGSRLQHPPMPARQMGEHMITWDSSLSLGVEEIDEQHRAIFKLVNELSEKKGAGDAAAATEILCFLRKYLNEHFDLETKLMIEMDYPDLEAHRQQHELFINNVIFFEIEKEFGVVSEEMLGNILEFLEDWCTKHILKEDKAFGDFIRAQAMLA